MIIYHNETGEIIERGENTGKYISRYYAKKVANETDMIIKDGNGYRIVDAYEYKRNKAKKKGE